MDLAIIGTMKQKIIVKQKNKQTQEEVVLADCTTDLIETKGGCHFIYHEKQPLNGEVHVTLKNETLTIERKGESQSTLVFEAKKKTIGRVESIYGVMELDLYTHVLGRLKDAIALEYDVCSEGQVLESYRFIFRFKQLV